MPYEPTQREKEYKNLMDEAERQLGDAKPAPQSETPRTDACPKSIGFLTIEIAKLERELNEAKNGKRKLSNDLIDCVRERDKLQQELDQVRGELEQLQSKQDSGQ